MRSALLIRAAAVGIGSAAVAYLVWAGGMMDRSYAIAAARCADLPDKYVPELGWMISWVPAALAIPLALAVLVIAARYPGTARGLIIAGLVLLGGAVILALQLSTAGCPAPA